VSRVGRELHPRYSLVARAPLAVLMPSSKALYPGPTPVRRGVTNTNSLGNTNLNSELLTYPL
jgi:hypothetical protein